MADETKAAPTPQEQVASRMLELMENINGSIGRFEYLEKLRAEELVKEIEAEVAQAEKREAAQKAYEERFERQIAASERTAEALERIAVVIDNLRAAVSR